jgi:L-amino acid N-acyltransferase YncA
VKVRAATPEDAAAIAAIHNEGIEDRIATFETEPRTPEDVGTGLAGGGPFLAAADDRGEVHGWARLSSYSDRPCYSGVAEASVYVARAARGGGVGRLLLESLAGSAERSGHTKLVALIFPENIASIGLFGSCGFSRVGVYRRHGRLDGEWRDVVLLERLLGEAVNPG